MTENARPSRREAASGLAAAALALGMTRPGAAHAAASSVFRHGVASGDPEASSLVLWTRITAPGPVEVMWEIAEEDSFKDGRFRATAPVLLRMRRDQSFA